MVFSCPYRLRGLVRCLCERVEVIYKPTLTDRGTVDSFFFRSAYLPPHFSQRKPWFLPMDLSRLPQVGHIGFSDSNFRVRVWMVIFSRFIVNGFVAVALCIAP